MMSKKKKVKLRLVGLFYAKIDPPNSIATRVEFLYAESAEAGLDLAKPRKGEVFLNAVNISTT